jgi:hypothetical protein
MRTQRIAFSAISRPLLSAYSPPSTPRLSTSNIPKDGQTALQLDSLDHTLDAAGGNHDAPANPFMIRFRHVADQELHV